MRISDWSSDVCSSDLDREAHRLALQGDARTRRAGHAERSAIAGADRGADRRNLILCLESRDVIFLEPRQMMEDRRRRGDRIAAEEHRQPRKLCAGDERSEEHTSELQSLMRIS